MKRGKYIAAVGFHGKHVTQKQLDKWKAGTDESLIVQAGTIHITERDLPWYAKLMKPIKSSFITEVEKSYGGREV